MKTDYHAKYLSYDLTKRCSSETIEKFVQTLSEAQVHLNPHQIDAALFAFRSPLSKGAILADEVGLDSFIFGFELATQLAHELKTYNGHLRSEQTADEDVRRLILLEEED